MISRLIILTVSTGAFTAYVQSFRDYEILRLPLCSCFELAGIIAVRVLHFYLMLIDIIFIQYALAPLSMYNLFFTMMLGKCTSLLPQIL